MVSNPDLVRSMFSMNKIDDHLYRCEAPHMGGAFKTKRLFGGQAVAQAFRAIQEDRGFDFTPSSLHYKFIGPGNPYVALDYEVHSVGSAFRVTTSQEGKQIGSAHCTFGHQFPTFRLELDYVKDAEQTPSVSEVAPLFDGVDRVPEQLKDAESYFYDIRLVEYGRKKISDTPRNMIWVKFRDEVKDVIPPNCGLQAALLLSDYYIIQIVKDICHMYNLSFATAASLHHTVRFHQQNEQVDPFDWFLFRTECSVANGHRSQIRGYVYDSRRNAVLSIVQEAYHQERRREPRPDSHSKL